MTSVLMHHNETIFANSPDFTPEGWLGVYGSALENTWWLSLEEVGNVLE
jgi:hypothetical protein